jgi:hypothetical protein
MYKHRTCQIYGQICCQVKSASVTTWPLLLDNKLSRTKRLSHNVTTLCVCVCVCMHVCMYICVYITNMYVYIYICMYTWRLHITIHCGLTASFIISTGQLLLHVLGKNSVSAKIFFHTDLSRIFIALVSMQEQWVECRGWPGLGLTKFSPHSAQCVYVYIFMYTHTHTHIHMNIWTYIHTYIHTCMCVCVCVSYMTQFTCHVTQSTPHKTHLMWHTPHLIWHD